MLLCMTEKDAIQAIDDAVAKAERAKAAEKEAQAELRRAVYAAVKLGYPKAKLARRLNKHSNTIDLWCKEAAAEEK